MSEAGNRSFVFMRKKRTRKKHKGYFLMIVPNKKGKINSVNIPYLVFVSFFVVMAINVYYLARYPFRISEIWKLEYHIFELRQVIAKQDKELRRLDPCLKSTQAMASKLNATNQFLPIWNWIWPASQQEDWEKPWRTGKYIYPVTDCPVPTRIILSSNFK